ncbi:hypothetical protein R1flu_001565 [Riccia fluitans]|uniref:Uncharacterized protein n=1 Tax=Riccia fluitans TaxID=41844 RepID=A0ABD1Y3M5_9MARC
MCSSGFVRRREYPLYADWIRVAAVSSLKVLFGFFVPSGRTTGTECVAASLLNVTGIVTVCLSIRLELALANGEEGEDGEVEAEGLEIPVTSRSASDLRLVELVPVRISKPILVGLPESHSASHEDKSQFTSPITSHNLPIDGVPPAVFDHVPNLSPLLFLNYFVDKSLMFPLKSLEGPSDPFFPCFGTSDCSRFLQLSELGETSHPAIRPESGLSWCTQPSGGRRSIEINNSRDSSYFEICVI